MHTTPGIVRKHARTITTALGDSVTTSREYCDRTGLLTEHITLSHSRDLIEVSMGSASILARAGRRS